MAKDDKVELSPDWYTLRVGADGECIFKEEPPPPVRTIPKKDKSKGKDTGTVLVPEESVAPTEQAIEIGKSKPVQRKASPRIRPSRPLKTSVSPSSSESSRSSASSWPPPRPSARTRKKPEPDIVEISDSDTAADKSTVSETQTASTRRSKAGPTRTPRRSPALPRTAVVNRSLPFGGVPFSGRGPERFYPTGATATGVTSAVTTSSGNPLSAEAIRILKALEDD